MPEPSHPVADLLKCYPPGTRALSLEDFNAAPDVPLVHASAGGASTVVYVGEACGIRPVAVIVPAKCCRPACPPEHCCHPCCKDFGCSRC